ncbi:MAG: Holliday junction resolvase RuvX [Bacteroidota bacterium]
MGRILSIDYGTKRVGLAVTDPLQIIATGLQTVSASAIFDFLDAYFKKEAVECVVVGDPKTLMNKASENARHVKLFLKKLKEKYPDMKVELIDERFTSSIAQRSIIESGLKKKDRRDKSLVDLVSATLILQTYMEMKSR